MVNAKWSSLEVDITKPLSYINLNMRDTTNSIQLVFVK